MEECLLRASSPEREVERSQEAKNTGLTGSKRQTEAIWKHKLCETQYEMWRGHGEVVPL